MTKDSIGKVVPPDCDGINHKWNYDAPIRCKGCGTGFTDTEALEREIELRKRGYIYKGMEQP